MANATQAIDAVEDWRALVDPDRLRDWMDTRGLGSGPLQSVQVLTGGTQNLLLRLQRGPFTAVLRRPPRHPRPQADATMLREARVLGALAGSGVPHPGLIAACDDPGVIGTAFYLMQAVDGFNPSTGLAARHAADAGLRHRMGLAMADAIATLGSLDPAAIGLSDFGRAEGFLERQVARWRSQLGGYASHAGWPGAQGLPGVAQVGDWLEMHRPAPGAPGLLHGDFHLANVLFRHDGAELAAVVDWELSTLGDPLLDLGWLLATWPAPDGSHHLPHRIQPWPGFPTAEQLVARYAERSSRDLGALPWYAVLACYKLAIVLEGTHARACAGLAPAATGERLHTAAVGLLHKASGWIARGSL